MYWGVNPHSQTFPVSFLWGQNLTYYSFSNSLLDWIVAVRHRLVSIVSFHFFYQTSHRFYIYSAQHTNLDYMNVVCRNFVNQQQ